MHRPLHGLGLASSPDSSNSQLALLNYFFNFIFVFFCRPVGLSLLLRVYSLGAATGSLNVQLAATELAAPT